MGIFWEHFPAVLYRQNQIPAFEMPGGRAVCYPGYMYFNTGRLAVVHSQFAQGARAGGVPRAKCAFQLRHRRRVPASTGWYALPLKAFLSSYWNSQSPGWGGAGCPASCLGLDLRAGHGTALA